MVRKFQPRYTRVVIGLLYLQAVSKEGGCVDGEEVPAKIY